MGRLILYSRCMCYGSVFCQVISGLSGASFKFLPASLLTLYFPGSSDGKESACNAKDLGSIPGSGRSPGEGNGNQLQYSCLENPMDREVWQTTVHGIAKSRTRLSNFTSVRVHLLCLQKQKVGKTPMKNYKSKTIT